MSDILHYALISADVLAKCELPGVLHSDGKRLDGVSVVLLEIRKVPGMGRHESGHLHHLTPSYSILLHLTETWQFTLQALLQRELNP